MRVPNDDDVVVFQRGSHPVITKPVLYSWVTAYIFVFRHPYSATAQQVFELREEGGGGGGMREGIFFRARRGHACGFLFKSDGECYYDDKTTDFFHFFSDVTIGSEIIHHH